MALAPVKSKVLVIEDQKEVADSIAMLLRRAGFEVTVANCGTDGIKRAQQDEFDLVTTDIDFPDISGFDVCTYLKQDFRFVRTPVIFISGRSTGENWRRAFELGAADFISKPFHPSIFISRILAHVKPTKN